MSWLKLGEGEELGVGSTEEASRGVVEQENRVLKLFLNTSDRDVFGRSRESSTYKADG